MTHMLAAWLVWPRPSPLSASKEPNLSSFRRLLFIIIIIITIHLLFIIVVLRTFQTFDVASF